MANKLLFRLKREYSSDNITLIANNHKDLEDYLRKTYNWYRISVNNESVMIVEKEGYCTEYASLEWVIHI